MHFFCTPVSILGSELSEEFFKSHRKCNIQKETLLTHSADVYASLEGQVESQSLFLVSSKIHATSWASTTLMQLGRSPQSTVVPFVFGVYLLISLRYSTISFVFEKKPVLLKHILTDDFTPPCLYLVLMCANVLSERTPLTFNSAVVFWKKLSMKFAKQCILLLLIQLKSWEYISSIYMSMQYICLKKLPFSKYIKTICEHLLFIGRLVFFPRLANAFFFAPLLAYWGLNCLRSFLNHTGSVTYRNLTDI